MDALSIISLADAKAEIGIDFDDFNANITRTIKTAVDWVERYTGYRLFERMVVLTGDSSGQNQITMYPVTLESVKNSAGVDVSYTKESGGNSLYVYCPEFSNLTLKVGYATAAEVPAALVEACFRLVTYLNVNKDIQASKIPLDIQILINQYRRNVL